MTGSEVDSVRAAVESLFSEFLVGEADDLPEQAVTGDPAARERLRERIAAMEAAAGRTVAQADAEYWAEEAAMDLPEPHPDEGAPLRPSEGVLILPTPREDALQAIVEDGEPVYLVDAEGRALFRRVPVDVTNQESFR
jgi:hypothetical protein